MKEIWTPITDFESYYEVSNKGNVRSLPRVIHYPSGAIRRYRGKVLKKIKCKDSYVVNLYDPANSCKHVRCVGTLVAEHFLPGFKESCRHSVTYIDKDSSNCQLSNLR